MNKPITIIYEEFKKNLTDTINNSGLPPFVIEPVLSDYLNEIRMLIKKQYEMDKNAYEEYLKSTEFDNKNEQL